MVFSWALPATQANEKTQKNQVNLSNGAFKFKWPVYIFTFGVYNSKQVNFSGIQIFRMQFMALHLRKVMLNAANIYLFGIIRTKCKYIYRSFIKVCLKRQASAVNYKNLLKSIFCRKRKEGRGSVNPSSVQNPSLMAFSPAQLRTWAFNPPHSHLGR